MLFNPQKKVRWDHIIIITVVVLVIDRGHGGPEIAFFSCARLFIWGRDTMISTKNRWNSLLSKHFYFREFIFLTDYRTSKNEGVADHDTFHIWSKRPDLEIFNELYYQKIDRERFLANALWIKVILKFLKLS